MLSEVEHEDLVADRHHQVHVVFDEQHRALQLGDQRAELPDLVRAQPAGRLVEQQQPGPGHQRAGERDPLAYCIGEAARRGVRMLGDTALLERGKRFGAQPALVALGPRQAEERRGEAGARCVLGAGHDVLEHGEPGKLADALQRAGDAETGEPVGAGPQRTAVQRQGTRGGRDEAADDVEERGLPGTVRPDDTDDPARRHAQRDVLERDEPAKANPDAMQDKPLIRLLRCHVHLGSGPCGWGMKQRYVSYGGRRSTIYTWSVFLRHALSIPP